MNVLVTGHRGYIGSHLVALLKAAGHRVVGCDLNLYQGCEWNSLPSPDREWHKDFRAISLKDLEGCDCVMHLAAISNDPMGALNAELTRAVNLQGSLRLATIAKQAGVTRFLFASSCSIYGKCGDEALTETGAVDPISDYAHTKIEAEREISRLANEHFSPTYLRNATAFGASPMLRLDLVVNNLLACAFAKREIQVQSDGSPWRPLIHAKDIARAFIAFLLAPRELIHNRTVNVGCTSANYQVRDIAAAVQRVVPSARVVFTGEVGKDPRNYRVNFGLLNQLLPHFKLEYDLERGVAELHEQFTRKGMTQQQFDGPLFFRLRTLKSRLDRLGIHS